MGFWNFFKSKKNDESENVESSHQNIGSIDLIFAENFTKSGGRFIFIDEINSTKEVFEKIFEENQWDSENVCSLNANVAKNLEIRSIRKIDNENVKALVTECEFLISNTGRILICSKQIKSNKIENLPSALIVLAKSNQQSNPKRKFVKPFFMLKRMVNLNFMSFQQLINRAIKQYQF